MANKVLLKKSSVAAKVPLVTDLDYGELAINYTDGKLYYKNASNAINSLPSGTVTSVETGNGLTGGTITTSGTISLADTAVISGSYTSANITVDAQGRITSASNGSARIRSIAFNSLSTIAPTSDTVDQYSITALAVAATIIAPTGTPVDGQRLTIRIEDNGTAQNLTWTTSVGAYRVIGTTLPITTVSSKVVYVGCIYNLNDAFWDVVSVAQQA